MRCILCKRQGTGELCKKHANLYMLDEKNNWYRKKKRLTQGVRKAEKRKKFHKTEDKLRSILEKMFGRTSVIASVHPRWALSIKGVLLEYDIAIPDIKLFIEYNGIQHYIYPNYFHKSRKQWIQQKARDRLKMRLAKLEGWEFMTFDYTEKITTETVTAKMREEGIQLKLF